MTLSVSDIRSNPNDQIAHAARVLGRSQHCKAVFEAIYKGKKKIKAVKEIKKITRLRRIRILQEGKKLANNSIVIQTKLNQEIAYQQDAFYLQNKKRIISLAGNKSKLERFPTKINPKLNNTSIKITLPKRVVNIKQLFIDDIDPFSFVKRIRNIKEQNSPIKEKKFKKGIQKIIKEKGKFTDWGGEKNDLFTTRIKIKNKRISVAFAFKGQGTKGKLTPKLMGKNGDQIQRLFNSVAEAFLVQYWDTVDESVIEQMKSFATAKSALENKKIYYGVIDGQDTQRLLTAYATYFK